MESLDNILESLQPRLEPSRHLSEAVLAAIALNRLRARRARRLLVCVLGLIVLLAAIAIMRSNTLQVITFGYHHSSAIAGHVRLYLHALTEVVPLMPILLLIAGVAVISRLRNIEHRAASLAPRLIAVTGAIGVLGISSGAFAAATANHTPGPAQDQLRRSVDGIGQTTVTIDGQTYAIANGTTGVSDTALKAQAEEYRLTQATAKIPQGSLSIDGGSLACLCRIEAMTATTIAFDYDDITPTESSLKVKTYEINAQTAFFKGSTKVAPFTLSPGTVIMIAPSPDLTHVAYVSQLTYPYRDYFYNGGFNATLPAHNANGKCYNYEAALCPNLSNSTDLIGYLPPVSTVPAGASIREVFGVVTSYSNLTVHLKDSTGTIWTFIIDPNTQSGIKPGAGLRVEFWQYNNDFSSRTVIDQSGQTYQKYGPLTKTTAAALIVAGKLNLSPVNQIRGLDLIPSVKK